MTARDSLLIALPAAFLGAAIGFFLSQTLGTESPTVKASLPSSAAAAAGPASTIEGESLNLAARDNQGLSRAPIAATPLPAPTLSKQEFARASQRVTAPEQTRLRGQGEIYGQVLNEKGEALAGVTLIAEASRYSQSRDPALIGRAAPADKSLDEALQERAARWAESRAERFRTLSDEAGQFSIQGLDPSLRYSINAYLQDYEIKTDESINRFSTGSEIVLRATPVQQVRVQVVMEDGSSLAEPVAIEIKRGSQRAKLFEWTREQPMVRVTPGKLNLRALGGLLGDGNGWGNLNSTHASEYMSLAADDLQDSAEVTLTLRPRTGLNGRLVDESGALSRRWQVYLIAIPEGGSLDEKALISMGQRDNQGTDTYSFLDLGPGHYGIGVSLDNREIIFSETVDVGTGLNQHDLHIPAPDANKALAVSALGPDGQILSGVNFQWDYRNNSSTGSATSSPRRDRSGVYWIVPPDGYFNAWDSETHYNLSIDHPDFGHRQVELTEGQREVLVQFDVPVSVLVSVEGYVGSGLIGQLSAQAVQIKEDGQDGTTIGGSRRGRNSSLDASGQSRIEGLSPGKWRIELQVRSNRWSSSTVDSEIVTCQAGEESVLFPLPALYDQVIFAPELENGTYMWLTQDQSEPGRQRLNTGAQLGEDGRATFKNLPAGNYHLNSNGEVPETPITVPSAEILLESKPFDALTVAIGDLKGHFATSGLEAGDLIIGTDGQEFEKVGNYWNLLFGEGTLDLMLLRKGQRMNLTFTKVSQDGGNWFENLGGMLTPSRRE